uniref:Uncharacterized protein n=1 Tax=Acrobeloides nanus TaxID=290746 RepID=A0A914EM98_9BILA
MAFVEAAYNDSTFRTNIGLGQGSQMDKDSSDDSHPTVATTSSLTVATTSSLTMATTSSQAFGFGIKPINSRQNPGTSKADKLSEHKSMAGGREKRQIHVSFGIAIFVHHSLLVLSLAVMLYQ